MPFTTPSYKSSRPLSRRIRKRPCCQQSAGCSKELLKIREIQPPRKSTSVAYFFDNVYNWNVRDVDNYLHVTLSINIYILFCIGQMHAWICYDDVGFRCIHKMMYNICRSALINTMCKVYANLAYCDCFLLLQHTSYPRNRYITQCNLLSSSLTNVTKHAQ